MVFISKRGKISLQKKGGALDFKNEASGGKLSNVGDLEVYSSGTHNFGAPVSSTRISQNTDPYKATPSLGVARPGSGFGDLDEIKFKLSKNAKEN